METMNEHVDELLRAVENFVALYGPSFTIELLHNVALDLQMEIDEGEGTNDQS